MINFVFLRLLGQFNQEKDCGLKVEVVNSQIQLTGESEEKLREYKESILSQTE